MTTSTGNREINRLTALGLLLASLVAASLLLLSSPAHAAATFTVDRNDDPDPATAKACTAAPSDCSLRGALVASNATAGADAITVPAGTYTLTRSGANEDAASTGDLDVTDELTITGAGARTTSVAGGPAPFDDRIFEIKPGAKAAITGLTITGGMASGDVGGGVFSQGDLTLDGVAVNKNSATGMGGIYSNGGTLNLTDSTVSGNSATGDVGGVFQRSGTANITNTTISGNRAGGFAGGVGAGATALVNIVNSTITSNTSPRLGGGILTVEPGTLVLVKNTILAGNSVDNCNTTQISGGIISSQGNNISSDESCPFAKTTDKQNTDPRLGSLQDNGGPTDTHALLPRSPAIDAADNAACPASDQRGVARPQGPRCDIGAFERPNDPPVARNDAYKVREDKTLKVVQAKGVLANDTDPDGDTLTARRISGPRHGRLTLGANGSLTYKPKHNFNGTDRFVYEVRDGRGGTDRATVTIRVRAVRG